MPVVGHALLQVRHTRGVGCADHSLAIGLLDPEARAAGDIIAKILNLILGIALTAVHRKHAPALRATKGGVLQVVVEHQDIAGGCLQGDRRYLAALQAPGLIARANAVLKLVGEGLADAVAAGDDPQRPGIARQPIQIERDLDVQHSAAPAIAVGVPARIAGVEVAVAAHVVEVIAQDAGRDTVDARIVKQGAEIGVLVDELDAARARGAVVYLAVVAAAVRGPDRLELLYDTLDPIGQQP